MLQYSLHVWLAAEQQVREGIASTVQSGDDHERDAAALHRPLFFKLGKLYNLPGRQLTRYSRLIETHTNILGSHQLLL